MIQKEDLRNTFLSQKSPRACVLPSAGVETKDCPVWASHSLLLWNGCRHPSSLTGVGQLCVARRYLQSVGTRKQSRPVETAFLLELCFCPQRPPFLGTFGPVALRCSLSTWSVRFLASGRLLTWLRTALAQLLLRGASAGGEAGGISGLPQLLATFLFLARGSRELPGVSPSVVPDSLPPHGL